MSEFDWSIIWQSVDPKIEGQAKLIAETGKFDDAILASLRYIESTIQSRISSTAIGQALLNDAFDGPQPKIQIGALRDAEWIKSIFAGAFGFVRNDRAHKAIPPTQATAMRCRLRPFKFCSSQAIIGQTGCDCVFAPKKPHLDVSSVSSCREF